MFRTFKRIAFALSVPAALAVGGWAQLTTRAADDATAAVSTADASRVDVPRERPDTSAADARIKPAPVLDRTAGGGAQPSAPAVKANTELVQKRIVTYRIKPVPIPDRAAGSGAQPPVPAVKADTERAPADAVTYPRIKPAPIPDRTAGSGAQPPVPPVKADTALAPADDVTYPPVKPFPIPDRTAGSGVQPPVPAVKAETELAPADAVTYPPIKPAPSPDRTARDGTAGQAEPLPPAVKANTEFAQATAAPEPSIEPAAAGDRKAEQKAEPAEQQPPTSLANRASTNNFSAIRSSTTETKKERQAALPRASQEDRPTRRQEREGESRRSKAAAVNARKAIVAAHQTAEQTRHPWNGPSALALRDHPMRLPARMAPQPATTCW